MAGRLTEFRDWAWGELKSLASKELFKYFVLTVGTLLSGVVVALFNRIIHSSAPITLDEFFAHPYDATIGVLKSDPIHSLSALFLIALIVAFLFLLRRARKRFDEQAKFVEDAKAARTLVSEAGLGGRWPHARIAEGGAPWTDLTAEILRQENNIIYILGANGIDTFGRPGAPLYETLRQFPGTIRVVLLKPDSSEVIGRSDAVGANPKEYNDSIQTSVGRLRDLRRQQHSIEGRYYDGQLNWKLLITNRTIWMQYYMPGGGHVDSTPVWRLDITPNDGCLYKYFYLEFDRIWRRCERNPMNLT